MDKGSHLTFQNAMENSSFKMRQKKKKTCHMTKINLLVCIVLCMSVLITLLNVYQLQKLSIERSPHIKGGAASVEGQSGTGKQPQRPKGKHSSNIKGGAPSVEGRSGTGKQLQQKTQEHTPRIEGDVSGGKVTRNPPVAWVHGHNLRHVKIVFKRLGFSVTTDGKEEWDVLWMLGFPFVKMSKLMHNLRHNQRVNHFPGCGAIVNKAKLSTLELDAMPKAFRIPSDKDKLITYARKNPSAKWVQKNNHHRGINVRKIEELDFKTNGTFVQEFVEKPYLIDGIFCAKEYYPFNASDVDTYTRSDVYLPMWKIPSFKDLYEDKMYDSKDSFDRYMINKGVDMDRIWSNIHDIIRTVYLMQQPLMLSTNAKYKTSKNFFELVRFDFILDEKLKVYLMEVNMSPGLYLDGKKEYAQFYQNLVYNVLRLTGVASMVENHFHESDSDMRNMKVTDRDVAVFSEWCISSQCKQCGHMRCSMCRQCMQPQQIEEYKDAYLEHMNRGSCRRMFPPEINQTDALRWDPENDSFGLSAHHHTNRNMYIWFIGMCRKDETFCM